MKQIRRFALLGALALIAAGCNVDWAQFRGSAAHTGVQTESVISTSNVGTLAPKWSIDTGPVDSSPVVVGGVLYITTQSGSILALDAKTGATKWTNSGLDLGDQSTPAVVGTSLYVGASNGNVYALDTATGTVHWTATTGGDIVSSPTVVNGIVYVGSADHKLYAFDATTGAVKWTATSGSYVYSSPAVANGIVYVPSYDGKMYAYDATTGVLKWSTQTGGGIFSSPSVVNGIVYVGTGDTKVYAFDATTGAIKWSTATGDVIYSSPAVSNGIVYIGSDDDKLYALDATTGAIDWTAKTNGPVQSSPVVANGVVYTGSYDSRLWAFDAATGALDFNIDTAGNVFSSPAVANGIVYVGDTYGTVNAYAPSTTRTACPPNPNDGMSPCQIQDAYRLPSQTNGSGRTVAIVDAYDNPNAESDLATFRAQYGLPACTTANGCFKKLNQTGATSPLPTPSGDWPVEIDLDIEAVSAACPLCHITLVEANTSSIVDLLAGNATAGAQHPTAVSNSWGAAEFAGESTYDGTFASLGVPVTVSTGDNGYSVQWPSSSPSVTAVGGTNLIPDVGARGWDESAWDGAGSGCSAQEAKQGWQHDAGCALRTVSDVSAIAGWPGLAMYDSYGEPGWFREGGTSLAAPLVAATYALAYPDYSLATTYAHAASLFDITAGATGSCSGSYLCTATTGYDGPTGLGTPCGIGAFGSGPNAATCPLTPAARSFGAADVGPAAPKFDATPECGPVPAGEARCMAERITPR